MSLSSVLALSIGGISAMLGLWVGRDKTRPVSFAVAMTLLIGTAVAVGIVQSVLDAEDAIQKKADLDRMVETVTEIAMASGDTELAALIEKQTGNKVEVPPPAPEPEAADTGAAGEAVAAEGAAAEGAAAEGAAAEGAAAEGAAAEGAAAEGAATPTPTDAAAPAGH
jgi:hypothetical protein